MTNKLFSPRNIVTGIITTIVSTVIISTISICTSNLQIQTLTLGYLFHVLLNNLVTLVLAFIAGVAFSQARKSVTEQQVQELIKNNTTPSDTIMIESLKKEISDLTTQVRILKFMYHTKNGISTEIIQGSANSYAIVQTLGGNPYNPFANDRPLIEKYIGNGIDSKEELTKIVNSFYAI